MSSVGDDLRQSMTDHLLAKELRRRRKHLSAKEHLRTACKLRQRAHRADPKHQDEAWQDAVAGATNIVHGTSFKTQHEIHDSMMAMYRDKGVV